MYWFYNSVYFLYACKRFDRISTAKVVCGSKMNVVESLKHSRDQLLKFFSIIRKIRQKQLINANIYEKPVFNNKFVLNIFSFFII